MTVVYPVVCQGICCSLFFLSFPQGICCSPGTPVSRGAGTVLSPHKPKDLNGTPRRSAVLIEDWNGAISASYSAKAAQAVASSGCSLVYLVMPTMVKTFWKWGVRPKVWMAWPFLLAAYIS